MVCPVCQSVAGGSVETWPTSKLATGYTCELCGHFMVSSTAGAMIGPENAGLTLAKRAALSHKLRRATDAGGETPMLMSDWIEQQGLAKLTLPSPGQQATNIIRFVGDNTRDTGLPLNNFPLSFHAAVGSITRQFAFDAAKEMKSNGLMDFVPSSSFDGIDAIQIRLTLKGWAEYDAEGAGKTAGSYGFLALKFGDEVLDPFVQSHLKPAVAELGFELRDMRDGARAGVIDNLMRIDIRDAAFVIADLTHDNAGSYWEAGYAEGLGKPVLYICEKSKFGTVKTHFDTNHSTTVQWDVDDPEAFKRDLIATLQRSLVV